MCMYSAVDGVVQEWHHTHLAQFASGGAGLIVAEATSVVPEGRISPRDAGLWNDEQRDAWRPIVKAIHDRGSLAGIQLAHAGRKASTWWPWADGRGSVPEADGGWTTFAPSAIAFEGFATPTALDTDGIEAVVDSFAAAARRAMDAGFDVLELHGAHGYLLHQFLSPLANRRNDEFGGSLENRARLLLRVIDAVRTVAGDAVPLFVRISATDLKRPPSLARGQQSTGPTSSTSQAEGWSHTRTSASSPAIKCRWLRPSARAVAYPSVLWG
jgi:2,4-dienoyl-CoA reductase-like NADH-dependent reductase (Old Yellow Enzyme family)